MTRLIDADAIFPWYVEAFKGEIEPHDVRFSMHDIEMNLSNIPTIDAVPVRHGRWISIGHKFSRICSVCCSDEPYKFADDDANVYDYCPNCGARMDGTQKKPCDDCQQFDCYGCEYAERKEE